MTLDNTQAAEIATFVAESTQLIEKLASENEQLKQAGHKPVLTKEAVEQTVDHLIKMGFDKQANRKSLVDTIVKEPGKLLGMLTKIAGLPKKAGTLPAMGKVASDTKVAAKLTQRESDTFFDQRFAASGK